MTIRISGVFLAALFVLFPATGLADLVVFETSPTGEALEIAVEDSSFEGLSLRLRLHAVEAEAVSTPRGDFGLLHLDGTSYTNRIGEPKVPVIRRLIQIPEEATVSISVEGTPERHRVIDLTSASALAPVQRPVEKVPGASQRAEFAFDPAAYGRDADLFSEAAAIKEIGHLRGYRVAWLEIRPVNYNPKRGEITLLRDLSVRVDFQGADFPETRRVLSRYADPRTEAIFNRLSFPGTEKDSQFAAKFGPTSYLIIGNPNFFHLPEFVDFVSFKEQKGYNVVSLSAAAAGSTAEAIRDTILDAYHGWEIPPAYVLLLGDTDSVPAFSGVGDSSHPTTDLYYQLMTEDDLFADLGLGRFPARTNDQLANMIRKTLVNETAGFFSVFPIQTAIFMASKDNFYISEATHEWVMGNFTEPLGYTNIRLYNDKGATTWQALEAINQGASLLTYSGHGGTTLWSDGPPVNADDVRGLFNPFYPMVFSFACVTGSYHIEECFSETWLRVEHGAVAMFASSVSSYWDEDDVLEKVIYDGFFGGDDTGRELARVSEMTDFGKLGLWQHYGGGGSSHRYMEMYNLTGDPDLMVFSEIPRTPRVQFVGEVSEQEGALGFRVENGPYAMVGLSKNGQCVGQGTAGEHGQGGITIFDELTEGEEILATVTGHNLVPLTTTLTVGETLPWDSDDDDIISFRSRRR